MSQLGVVQFFTAASYSTWRDICAPHYVTCDPSWQSLPTPPSPAFSGLCISWWGLPGCGDAVSILQECSGGSCWVQLFPTQAGSQGLAEAEMFLECECRILCDLDWENAHLATPRPQRRPKINIAQIASPSNKQSVKIAVLPLRLRLIKVGSDCRSWSLLGLCSNKAFAAPWRHGKNMKWHNLQRLYH